MNHGLKFATLLAGLTASLWAAPAKKATKEVERPARGTLLFGKGPALAPPPVSVTALSDAFVNVMKQASPWVVSVYTSRTVEVANVHPFQQFFGPEFGFPRQGAPEGRKQQGGGSGFVVDPAGYVLTNAHVVKDMDEIKVELSDRTRLEATVVGMDEKSDVALLKLPVRKDGGKYPSASFADSDSLKIGEMVLAIGNPFQFRNTITMGIVSATGRTEGASADAYADYIQTDAAVNPGNSGGPLVNLRGQVVGINSSIWTRSGGYQGISFAIPINQARRIAEDLAYDGEVSRGWLGVSIEDLDSELAEALGIDGRNGAKIVQVNPQTPAEKAGLKAGDVVLAIDGHVVSGSADLRNRVAALRPNQKVNFRLQRDGKELVLPVVVGRLKGEVTSQGDGEEVPSGVRQEADGSYTLKNLGLRLSVLDDKARERGQVGKEIQGVAVAVLPDSPASDKAIPDGAVLVAWKGPQAGGFQPVKDLAAVVAELRRVAPGSAVALMFQKGEQKRLVGLKATGP